MLGSEDGFGRLGQFGPIARWLLAVFFEEIPAIIKQARVDEERYGDEFPGDGVIGEQRIEMIVQFICRNIGLEIDEMIGERARPDDIDLEYVDVGGARGQELLIESEPLIGIGWSRDQLY